MNKTKFHFNGKTYYIDLKNPQYEEELNKIMHGENLQLKQDLIIALALHLLKHEDKL